MTKTNKPAKKLKRKPRVVLTPSQQKQAVSIEIVRLLEPLNDHARQSILKSALAFYGLLL